MQGPIIIAGFHRSGTSMVAEYLHMHGVHMGDDLMGGDASNPRGHYEDMEVFSFHEKLLGDSKIGWLYDGSTPIKPDNDKTLKNINSLIKTRSDYNVWGFKDPRVCLFLHQWYQALGERCIVIMIYRHYSECLRSLYLRHARNLIGTMAAFDSADASIFTKPTLVLRSWLIYNQKLLDFYKSHADRCLVINQRTLVDGFDLADALQNRFAVTLNNHSGNTISTELTDTSSINLNLDWLDGDLKHQLDKVWSKLTQISVARSSPTQILNPHPIEKFWSVSLPKVSEDRHAIDELEKINTLLERQESSKALEIIQSNLVIDPLAVNLISAQGRALIQLGRYQDAERCFTKALAIDQNHFFYYVHLAIAIQHQKKYREAEFFFNKSVEKLPNNPDAYIHRGRFFRERGRFADAEADFIKALSIKPMVAQAVVELSLLFEQQNQLEKALSILEHYKPEHLAPILKRKCDLLARLNRIKESQTCLKQLYRWNRQHRDLDQYLEKFWNLIPIQGVRQNFLITLEKLLS